MQIEMTSTETEIMKTSTPKAPSRHREFFEKLYGSFDSKIFHFSKLTGTGKSLSESLIFAEHGENMLCTEIVLNVKNNLYTQHLPHVLSLEFSCIELVIQ